MSAPSGPPPYDGSHHGPAPLPPPPGPGRPSPHPGPPAAGQQPHPGPFQPQSQRQGQPYPPAHQPPAAPRPGTSSTERAPLLLPLAFLSAFGTALPLLLALVYGVAGLTFRGVGLIGILVAVVVGLACVTPGLTAAVRAMRRCRSLPRVGGILTVVGCVLQVLLIVIVGVLLMGSSNRAVGGVTLVVVLGGAMPALLNLVGGILGLQRPQPQ